jgi:signal transduction histidine kinase
MSNILIVEDSPTQAERLASVLESRGHAVVVATSSEAALDLWPGSSFDLVISDVVMPGVSGYELCKKIKASPESTVPVMLLTSLNEPMDIIRGLECGADNFITKPYRDDHLIERTDRILEHRRLRVGERIGVGIEIMFLGRRFTISSEKEQILDLLLSSFEDTVRANQELQTKERDLAAAKAQLETYARTLEERVTQRSRELEEANQQLRQAQKMEAIGRLTGGIAHDFNNLLGVITTNLDLLIERIESDIESAELAREALGGALRGAELTQRMLAFARKQPLHPMPVDLNELLPGMATILKRTLGAHINVEIVPGEALWPALCDRSQVEDAILNLSINARDAMPDGGRLMVETTNIHLDEDYTRIQDNLAAGDYVMLAVSDTGTGMSPDVIERAFEPFFSTKPTGRGTGLGLSMVYGFAKQSGGHVKIYSELGHGTTVRLYLPRAVDKAPVPNSNTERSAQPRGHETILVVEDDPNLRLVVVRLLRGLGYVVREAENAAGALTVLAADPEIALLFTDVVMPGGMTGLELASAALDQRSDLKVLLTSGYSESFVANGNGGLEGVFLITKPYRKQDLAAKLREILDAGRKVRG